MSKKNLIYTALILAVIAVAIQYFSDSQQKKSDPRLGLPLAEDNLIETIDEIILEDAKTAIHMKKKEDQWLITEKDNYPADIEELIKLLDNITTYKIASLVTRNPDRLAHFKLKSKKESDSDEKSTGTLLKFKGDNQDIFQIIVGKNRDSVSSRENAPTYPDGTYVRIGDESTVYLIKENLTLDTDLDNWMQKVLVKLEKDQIKSIKYQTPEARFIIERESKDQKLSVPDLEDDKKMNDSEISEALTELERFSIQQILPRNQQLETELELKSAVSVELFDKSSFDFQLLTKTETDPLQKKEDPEKTVYYVKILPSSAEIAKQKWQPIYTLAEKWLFELEEWKAKKWIKTREDFVVSKEKE